VVDSETKKASIFNAYAICVSFVPVENGTQITKLPQQPVETMQFQSRINLYNEF